MKWPTAPWPTLGLAIALFGAAALGATLGGTRDFATTALTVAAVAQAIFAAWSTVSAKEAKRSADAANATLALADRTARQQLRAYVDLDEACLRMLDDHSPQIVLIFKNFGQTPARITQMRASVAIGDDPAWDWPWGGQAGSQVTWQPGQMQQRTMRLANLGDDLIAQIVSGEILIRVKTSVHYLDVFDQEHIINWKGTSVPRDWTIETWDMHWHVEHS